MKKKRLKQEFPLGELKKLFCIMKLVFFFLLLSSNLVWAGQTYAQITSLNLELKNVTLEEVFDAIRKQSEFEFFYNNDQVNTSMKVSVKAKNADIYAVLEQVLPDIYEYKINDRYILVNKRKEAAPVSTPQPLQQTKKKITGSITDKDGEAIIGANIMEKGTTNGTITDIDGKFALQVSDDAVLTVSYIGYLTQEAATAGKNSLNITLNEDATSLEEVVVVGYGSMKKANLTGAVAQVKGEVIENRSVSNIGQALQGSVANLNITSSSGGAPGNNPTYNIRGYTGFSSNGSTSSQAPLVVIDGIQGGDINTINMNDVESISVLKDAASAAIYGSSAPYGVIIINTKKGKTGQKPTISYSNNFMFSQPINLPKYMKSIDFANTYNEARENANLGRTFDDNTLQRIQDYLDGKITTETIANPTSDSWYEWGNGNANNDWFKILYKNVSFSQQHNANVSGGTSHSNYYVGLGYLGQGGMYNYTEDSYDRFSVRANNSSKITDWLEFNFRGAFVRGATDSPYVYEESNAGGVMKMLASRNWPTEPLYVPNGSFASENRMAGFVNGGRTKVTTDNTILTGEFVIRPLKGWDITANYSYDGSYINESRHKKTVYVIRPSGAEQALYAPNAFERRNNKNQHHTINLFSSYEKQWSDHYFKGMIGFTQELYDNLYLYGYNNNLYSDDLPALALTYGTSPSTTDNASQLAIRGGFGRINYNYKGKYLVELNGRYDGTSRFLKDVRYKFYPGVSAAWVLSSESFWEPVQKIVSFLKVRASYGQLGDQAFTSNYYPFYPSLNATRPTSSNWLFSGGKEAYINQPGLIDQKLTWVTTSTLDFGADFSLLANRLNVSFDWYQRGADDFVGPTEDFPAFLGTSPPQVNNSAMVTHGIELTIGWKDKIKDFSYGVSTVISDYQSEIRKYPNSTELNTTWYKGRKLGDIWGYETVGFFKTEEEIASAPSQEIFHSRWTPGDIRYADLNSDGVIDWGDNTLENPGDRKVIGNSTPRFAFGVTLNAEYKGFDAVVFLQGIGKRDVIFLNEDAWDAMYFWGITGGQYTSMLTTEHYDRWTEENPNGYFPKYYMSTETRKNQQAQTKYMQSGSYLRIKNIQLGYSLPASLMQKINCQKIRVFINIENLATFTSLIKTMDPEFCTTDGRIYPLQRVWACGLNITF